jgi:hypothetical protein
VAGRLLAASIGRTHPAAGHDVIMPQLITNAREIADFDTAPPAARAEYCHTLLTADVESAISWFTDLATADNSYDGSEVRKIVDERGGADFLPNFHGQLTEFAAGRRLLSVIDCEDRHRSRPTVLSLPPWDGSPRGIPHS